MERVRKKETLIITLFNYKNYTIMENEKGIIVQHGTSEELALKELQADMKKVLAKLDEIEKKLDAMA